MSGCHWWCYFVPRTLSNQNADACSNYQIVPSSAVAVVFSSWLNHRRRRYLLLILCSPFLLPVLCALCPLLCMAEMCFLIFRRRQESAPEKSGLGSRLCVEGGAEVWLLQRYLEDQMSLVVGDDDEKLLGIDGQYFDCARAINRT